VGQASDGTNGSFGNSLQELTWYSSGTFNMDRFVGLTEAPIRYADGVIRMDTTDLESDGFGVPWGQTRSWTNGADYVASAFNGNGTLDV